MQQAPLSKTDTARRTGDREKLFCGEVAHPHLNNVRQSQSQKLFHLEHNARKPSEQVQFDTHPVAAAD